MQEGQCISEDTFSIEVAALPYRYNSKMNIDFGIIQNENKKFEVPSYKLKSGEGIEGAVENITDKYLSKSEKEPAMCLDKHLCCIMDSTNNESPLTDYSSRIVIVYRLDFRGDQNFNSSIIWKNPIEMADMLHGDKFERDHENVVSWVIRSNG